MQAWEYLEIELRESKWSDSLGRGGELESFIDSSSPYPARNSAALLNELGAQGWELIGVQGSEYVSRAKLYLKRPKAS